MDEYLNDDTYISKDHPLSFRGFMQREVYDRIDPALVMPEEQRVFPDPAAPERVGRLIEELGGVDIAFGAIDAMPRRCVTIGMKEILGAGKVRIGVFRDWHRSVVRQAACGEPLRL